MSRGILWIAWGDNERVETALSRSMASVARWHPELPTKIARMPDGSDLRCKAQMYNLAEWATTLYLDADTVVMGNLDHAFEMAERFGLACAINVCPWARRYRALESLGDMVEYDTGVVAFDKRFAHLRHVFGQWIGAHYLDSASHFLAADGVARMPTNDQCAFAAALWNTGFNPRVLPVNYNVHPKWTPIVFGEVKVWHDYNDPPDALAEWNAEQSKAGAVIKPCRISEGS